VPLITGGGVDQKKQDEVPVKRHSLERDGVWLLVFWRGKLGAYHVVHDTGQGLTAIQPKRGGVGVLGSVIRPPQKKARKGMERRSKQGGRLWCWSVWIPKEKGDILGESGE